MNCLSRVSSYTAGIVGRASHFIWRSTSHQCSIPLWKRSFDQAGLKTVNLESLLPRFRVQCYSSRKASAKTSPKRKLDPAPAVMEQEKDAFFVVRKGDIVGVYKSFADCQAQAGSSICDPPVSVYKGYALPKDTEGYLMSHGLQNALYTIRASDLKEDLFGTLVPCPFQQPTSSKGATHLLDATKKRSQELLDAHSCILEFDGASKGNPGPAGAGALLRTTDGSVICRLREGLGRTTNNVAEYRAMILGLKYALKRGYTKIQVQGDSKLVCSQIQGLWKVNHPNLTKLYEEAKQLKDKFVSFQINHVLREFNSQADAQANFAINLADGQVEEESE
ncbi:uncharacterized protein LOC110600980 isoform X2 [Manihot esculenta]|uniref:uncharacterized protein LOC110600980 isoform X2 n=1 Tax=Manihot esculenta TaxID=3983 RepID=UPI001CC3F808|nr:uncharacterized protein LOC110600980 isoform X2 [Manihot esculenta]